MKKKFRIFIFLSILLTSTYAQPIQFSDSTTASLLICSPGEEVYAMFGHAGIRVKDEKNKLDVVFNYGIFSFNTENFYLKFIKGETDYMLGVSQTEWFLDEYKQRNSTVWEQKFNLNAIEQKQLIDRLLNDYKPENKVYRYNFAYENCATRPRNRILNSVDGFIKIVPSQEPRTFRTWINGFTNKSPWVKFGINLIFGMDADKIATPYESMFLPELLMAELENVVIVTKDSLIKETKLVSEKLVLVNNSNYKNPTEIIFFNSPTFFFLLVLLIALLITFWEIKKHHYALVFDSILLLISGIVGILIFYLMFISIHPLVKNNLNLLIFNPLNAIAAILIWFKRLRYAVYIYSIVNICLIVITLTLFVLSLQSFDLSLFIVIILLVLRYLSYIFNSNQKPIIKNSKNKLTSK